MTSSAQLRDEAIWIPRERRAGIENAREVLLSREGWMFDRRLRQDRAVFILLRSVQRQALLAGVAVPWAQLRREPPF
jgi:hypothetical protein